LPEALEDRELVDAAAAAADGPARLLTLLVASAAHLEEGAGRGAGVTVQPGDCGTVLALREPRDETDRGVGRENRAAHS